MTKVFLTIPWFSPAFKAGGPIRSIENMIRAVPDKVQFFIFTSDGDINNEKLPGIKKDAWIVYNQNTKVYYASSLNRSNRLLKECERVKPDVILITGIYSWHFTCVPLFFGKAPRRIISPRGMLHTEALRQKALKKNLYLSLLRLLNIRNRTVFHATDAIEETYVKEVFGKQSVIHIAGNIPTLYSCAAAKEKQARHLVLISVCLLSPMKNIHQVLKALKQVTAVIDYHIYGVIKDKDYWELCKSLLATLPDHITVTLHGELQPTEVEAALAKAHVFIQPSESENYGHSLVEALSAGLPVITSHQTPWNDLRANKAGINVEPIPADIAHAIQYFALMDELNFSQWQLSASAYILQKTDLEAVVKAYKKLFLEV